MHLHFCIAGSGLGVFWLIGLILQLKVAIMQVILIGYESMMLVTCICRRVVAKVAGTIHLRSMRSVY